MQGFHPIHMPKNTGAGAILSAMSVAFGFAMIWHIWWLAALAFALTIITTIVHTFNYNRDFYIPASEVAQTEGSRTQLVAGE
jgi:cytochrome o ubiquinol oxidase subunit 1